MLPAQNQKKKKRTGKEIIGMYNASNAACLHEIANDDTSAALYKGEGV
jgi:hypothetical protein